MNVIRRMFTVTMNGGVLITTRLEGSIQTDHGIDTTAVRGTSTGISEKKEREIECRLREK